MTASTTPRRLTAALAALALLLAGCTSTPRRTYATGVDPGRGPITIGADHSAESRVVAALYARLLTEAGEHVRVVSDAPYATSGDAADAVVSGVLDLAPAYESDLLRALPAGQRMSGDTAATLSMALPVGIDALSPAAAQRGVVLAVSPATAQRYHLRSLADLAKLNGRLTLGGTAAGEPDAPSATALSKAYGVTFAAVGAQGSVAQVLMLRSTDPATARDALVVLADPKALLPPENVFPLISADHADKRTRTALDRIDSALTTDQLAALSSAVTGGESPDSAAAAWLRAHGLG